MEKIMETVNVAVQTEERMKAITSLAVAIADVAKSLLATPTINIRDCTFGGSPKESINIETGVAPTETVHVIE